MRTLIKLFMVIILYCTSCNGEGSDREQDSGPARDTGAGTDMDADADMDADMDADADVDADADCDRYGDCGYGEKECITNTDCALIACGCKCPNLWIDETTSYCYKSCYSQDFCDAGQECVIKEEEATSGVCLRTGYFEMTWQGKYIPADVHMYPEDLTPVEYELQIGSLSEKIEWIVIRKINNITLGELIQIYGICSLGPIQVSLVISFPYDLWKNNTTINLSSCDDSENYCSAELVNAYVSGPGDTKGYIRAINMIGTIDTSKESWIHIEKAPKMKGQVGNGTLKIYLAEYSAEISLDSPMPKLPLDLIAP